jgi:drug/metabolite transporter (DMT)-like permease
VLLMVLVAFLWSTAGVVSRHLEAAQGFELTFWRSFFTVLSLLIILPVFQGKAVFSRIFSGGKTLWLSGICWAFMFTAYMVALTLTTVANVLVVMALAPLFTALMARAFIAQKIPARTWWAIAVASIGMVWIYAGQLDFSGQINGMLVALMVPFAAASNWTLVQYSRTHGSKNGSNVDLVPAVLMGAVISTLIALPLSLPLVATPHDMLLLGTLGLMQLAVPCVLAVLCARVLKAPEMSLLALLEVVFGILLAWVGAGEVPGANVLWGGSLVIAALVANELLGWKQNELKK